MARREFQRFEAVSAMVPGEGGYSAAIAVKQRHAGGTPHFHKVLDGQLFKSALAADDAASGELARLRDISEDGELLW